MNRVEKMQSITAKKAEAEHGATKMFESFRDFFQELEQKEIDVEAFALDPWKPKGFMLAAACYAYLIRTAAQGNLNKA